jgi:hypothetical protein
VYLDNPQSLFKKAILEELVALFPAGNSLTLLASRPLPWGGGAGVDTGRVTVFLLGRGVETGTTVTFLWTLIASKPLPWGGGGVDTGMTATFFWGLEDNNF